MPSAEPWPAGLTTIGKSRRSSIAGSASRGAELLERGLAERVEVGRRHAGVAQRVLGDAPCPCSGCRPTGRRRCTGSRAARAAPGPCRPRRRGRAAPRTRRRGAPRRAGPRGPGRRRSRTTSWPSRSSASSTRAPERSETCRSSESPPLRTATFIRPCAAAAARATSGSARRLGAPAAARRRLGAGQRAVERDLLADDLADPPDALADRVVADAGEVQPHLRAAAAVEVGRAARHERDVVAQRARQQVGRVDVVRQPRPDEQAALRAASRSPRAGSARRAPRA